MPSKPRPKYVATCDFSVGTRRFTTGDPVPPDIAELPHNADFVERPQPPKAKANPPEES